MRELREQVRVAQREREAEEREQERERERGMWRRCGECGRLRGACRCGEELRSAVRRRRRSSSSSSSGCGYGYRYGYGGGDGGGGGGGGGGARCDGARDIDFEPRAPRPVGGGRRRRGVRWVDECDGRD